MENQQDSNIDFFDLFNNSVFMKTFFLLIIHFVVLIFKLLKPGGLITRIMTFYEIKISKVLKIVAAENLAIRQQFMIATRIKSPSTIIDFTGAFFIWFVGNADIRISH
jgi:hypothetical protein